MDIKLTAEIDGYKAHNRDWWI